MQNSIKKISFKTEKGNSILEFGYQLSNNQFVNVDSLFQEFKEGFLFKPIHKFVQTQYILNEVKGCWILSFDKARTLVSVKKFNNETSLPNTYLIAEEYVVFLPIESEIPSLKVESFEINSSKSDTLAENEGQKFPYIIIRKMATLYQKIHIKINSGISTDVSAGFISLEIKNFPKEKSIGDLLQEKLLDGILKEVTANFAKSINENKLCLVLQQDRCFFYEDDEFVESDEPPSGGILIEGDDMSYIPDLGKHY